MANENQELSDLSNEVKQRISADRLAKRMRRAAKRAGLSIDTSRLTALTRDDLQAVATTIEGFEDRPAVELPDGVDYGFVYLSLPGATDIPEGFYRLRARLHSEPVLGQNHGVVELFNVAGERVGRAAAEIQVNSLEVPENRPPNAVTEITTSLQHGQRLYLCFCYLCPNGYIVCTCFPLTIVVIF